MEVVAHAAGEEGVTAVGESVDHQVDVENTESEGGNGEWREEGEEERER